MKRREIKSTYLLLMVLLALIVTACGKLIDITTTTVKEEPKSDDYSISKNTINMMDAAISNLKDGHVSDRIL